MGLSARRRIDGRWTPVVRLDNWSIVVGGQNAFLAPELRWIRLRGTRRHDGATIISSAIQDARARLVFTRNTVYELGRIDP